MPEKIFLITNIPTPYRVPLFNSLADWCSKTGRTLKVIFLARSYRRRKWEIDSTDFGFDFQYLRSPKITFAESFFSLGLDLLPVLVRERPSQIITAGFSVPSMIVLIYCRMFDCRFILWSGEIREKAEKRRSFLGARKLFRMILARNSNASICYGSRAKMYMESLGSRNNHVAVNTVDTTFFRNEIEKRRVSETDTADEFSGTNILYVGNLLFQKGLRELISAFSIVKSRRPDAALHLVGEGGDREALQKMVQTEGIRDVTFWGFHQLSELPRFYAFCDVFVFPSFYDVWGLVLNEALCALRPIVASVYAGATQDLVVHGENGFVCHPEKTGEFAHYIEMAGYDPSMREKADKINRERLGMIGIGQSVAGFQKALEASRGMA